MHSSPCWPPWGCWDLAARLPALLSPAAISLDRLMFCPCSRSPEVALPACALAAVAVLWCLAPAALMYISSCLCPVTFSQFIVLACVELACCTPNHKGLVKVTRRSAENRGNEGRTLLGPSFPFTVQLSARLCWPHSSSSAAHVPGAPAILLFSDVALQPLSILTIRQHSGAALLLVPPHLCK